MRLLHLMTCEDGENSPFEPPYFRLSPTTVRFVAQIGRRQFMLLRSSRSSGEKWLYRPVSISLSRANGGISRKARIALCTSWRTGGFCCVLECATWYLLGVVVTRSVERIGLRDERAATLLVAWFVFGALTGGLEGFAGLLPDFGRGFGGGGSLFPLGGHEYPGGQSYG